MNGIDLSYKSMNFFDFFWTMWREEIEVTEKWRVADVRVEHSMGVELGNQRTAHKYDTAT